MQEPSVRMDEGAGQDFGDQNAPLAGAAGRVVVGSPRDKLGVEQCGSRTPLRVQEGQPRDKWPRDSEVCPSFS